MGVIGAVIAVFFGFVWIGIAKSIGAPPLFVGFGVICVGAAIINGIFDLRNAVGKNRYSEYDIVDSSEESDPLNERFGQAAEPSVSAPHEEFGFCPYCGTKREKDHLYCGKCGKRIG